MPSYQTIVREDEKSSLLGAEFVRQHPTLAGPIVIEHYHDGARCTWDSEAGRRKRRAGCCSRLCSMICSIIFWTILAVFALAFLLRLKNGHTRFPNLWNLGSPVENSLTIAKCPSTPISYKSGELKYGFNVAADSKLNEFYFGQRYIGQGTHFIQTAGQVIVQAAPGGAVDPITVDLDIKLSHNELGNAISIKREAGGIIVESDTFLESFTGVLPCVSIVATISVMPTANISSFNIDTATLPVGLKDSFQLISKNIFIQSKSGSISSETTSLSTRNVNVKTTSNTISGSFPLADLLMINTVSGAVNVDIEPKETGAESTLVIHTASGNINAETIVSTIPNSAYNTQVHTVSGSISGTFLLGASSSINSANGAISAVFYTAGDLQSRSCVINSISGSVRSTIYDDSYELGILRSNFHSQSGSVDLQFPAAWEGHIQAESKTGSIAVTGDGVNIVKNTSSFPGAGRIVIAEKGDSESNISAQTLNADIAIRIG